MHGKTLGCRSYGLIRSGSLAGMIVAASLCWTLRSWGDADIQTGKEGSKQVASIERVTQRGPVTATVRLTPGEPLIGDPIELTIDVMAEPDVELLMPEFGEVLDRFPILDFVPRKRVNADGSMRATQTYRLQPTMSGGQSIPPILVEFVDRRSGKPATPDGEDAFELLTERIDFSVRSVLPSTASDELKPPLGELQPLGMTTGVKVGGWILLATLLVCGTVPFLYRYWQARQRVRRRRSAYEIARGRLDRLKLGRRPLGEAIGPFFVELSDIIRRYLEDRFDLRAPELTTEEFLETVRDSRSLSSDHQRLLDGFLRQADLVKFAGIHPADEDIARAVAAADRFLEETGENAPLIDEVTGNTVMSKEPSVHV